MWRRDAGSSCWIHATSSGEIDGCSSGRSRYHARQAAAHTTPVRPKITNDARQPHWEITSSASGTEIMPPTREPSSMTPLARPRSLSGNQRDKLRAMFGNAPASPAPNRKRITTSDRKPCAAPVSMVKADHHNTIRVSTRRGPLTSPSQPEGTSNSE